MSDQVTATSATVQRAQDKIDRATWFIKAAVVVGVLAILGAVVTFGLINIGQQNASRAHTLVILKKVQDATDPNSQLSKQANAQQAAVVKNLILCLENHEDRLAGHRVPVMPGCP